MPRAMLIDVNYLSLCVTTAKTDTESCQVRVIMLGLWMGGGPPILCQILKNGPVACRCRQGNGSVPCR